MIEALQPTMPIWSSKRQASSLSLLDELSGIIPCQIRAYFRIPNSGSLSAVFKRVAISKNETQVSLASKVRPIDVFSCVLRIHASALVQHLRPKLSWMCECAALDLRKVLGLRIGLEKMLKILRTQVAILIATYLGLSVHNAMDVGNPILNARGVWRLPGNALPELVVNSRGLPQGMTSSVLLAELAISLVLWKLHLLLLWSYVDDLNLAARAREKPMEALAIFREFEHNVSLSTSDEECVDLCCKRQRRTQTLCTL